MEVLENINAGFRQRNFRLICESLNIYLNTYYNDVQFHNHPLGFKFIKLGEVSEKEEFRLHLWHEGLSKQDEDLMIHDHSFDIFSCVIFGSLVNKIYSIETVNKTAGYLYKVKYSNNISKLILMKNYQQAVLKKSKTILQGEFYNLSKVDFHETNNMNRYSLSLVKIIRSENKHSMVFSDKLLSTSPVYERAIISPEISKTLVDDVLNRLKGIVSIR